MNTKPDSPPRADGSNSTIEPLSAHQTSRFSSQPKEKNEFPLETSIEALKIVLAVSFDRNTLSSLLLSQLQLEQSINLWPSTLYRMAAEVATHSLSAWAALEPLLNEQLNPWADYYLKRPPVETISLFAQTTEFLHGHELAGALWAILRRRDPALTELTNRLTNELNLFAMQQFRDLNCSA